MISPSPWTVREGRSTRYLYVCDAEGTKIAEVDLWAATAEDAVLMANAPQLAEAAKLVLEAFDKGVFVRSIDGDDKADWAIKAFKYISALARLCDAATAADTPFVQGYKPAVSQE